MNDTTCITVVFSISPVTDVFDAVVDIDDVGEIMDEFDETASETGIVDDAGLAEYIDDDESVGISDVVIVP